MLPDSHIEKFQELYKKHYGIEITKQQALLEGLRLAGLVQVGLGLNLSTNKYEYEHEEYEQ